MKERLRQKPVIYVSGKIGSSTPEGMSANQDIGIKKGAKLMADGWAPIIPHGNLKEVYKHGDFSYRQYMLVDFAHLKNSDTVYMMHNWKESPGARKEERYARLLKKKIIYENVEEKK